MQIETIPYAGWGNCYRLANGLVDLVVTGDIGPRIIRFGFLDQENEFKEFENEVGLTGGEVWRSYGGHRLWHAPEAMPRSYIPDNSPVDVAERDGGLHVVQPVEALTGIQKEMQISLDEESAHVRVVHRLRNLGLWPVELAAWGLSVMDVGGTLILPLPSRGSHPEYLLPANALVLWPYTDLSDPRLVFGERFILLRQDRQAGKPMKIGASVPDGWMAYARGGHLFVKKSRFQPGAPYPDMGSSFETWTNHEMLEVESLSPLTTLQPEGTLEHVEDWYLFDGIPAPSNDKDVFEWVMPVIKSLSADSTG
jgi:hypothetical protein